MISASIIADSLTHLNDRLTTFVVTFPRIVLAEFNTHRMLSRNSASSRARPHQVTLKEVKENPFIPIAWMKNHKGMQGEEYVTDADECDWNGMGQFFCLKSQSSSGNSYSEIGLFNVSRISKIPT